MSIDDVFRLNAKWVHRDYVRCILGDMCAYTEHYKQLQFTLCYWSKTERLNSGVNVLTASEFRDLAVRVSNNEQKDGV